MRASEEGLKELAPLNSELQEVKDDNDGEEEDNKL
jgi:hypothetical protein